METIRTLFSATPASAVAASVQPSDAWTAVATPVAISGSVSWTNIIPDVSRRAHTYVFVVDHDGIVVSPVDSHSERSDAYPLETSRSRHPHETPMDDDYCCVCNWDENADASNERFPASIKELRHLLKSPAVLRRLALVALIMFLLFFRASYRLWSS